MAEGKGFGKAIIFGEHFVVYGLPGIAGGINLFVKARVEKGQGIVFQDSVFKETVDYEKQPQHIKSQIFKPVFQELGVSNVKISITGTLLPSAGMGYSAALAVAVIRALNKFYGLGMDKEQVNRLAYKAEEVSHGTPSGIDNTCATFGGTIWFEKNLGGGENRIEKIGLGAPLPMVIASSGSMGNTKKLVARVRERREKSRQEFDKIFEEYKKIALKAKEALKQGKLQQAGTLMDKNQVLLQKIGVSTTTLEEMCRLSKEKGALGAKLTGAGGGGCMIALCSGKAEQEKVFKALAVKGYKAFKTEVNST